MATRQALFTQLDSMREDMEEADKSAMVEEKLLLGAAKGISLTLFAGTVKWYLKAGSLLASLLSSLPLWTPFDPLPVLSMSRQEKKRRKAKNRQEEKEEDGKSDKLGRLLDTGGLSSQGPLAQRDPQ